MALWLNLLWLAAAAGEPEQEPAPAPEPPALVQCLRQPPQYPPASLGTEESGDTNLLFEVDADGVASDAVIQRSSGFAKLDQAALRHFRRCLDRNGRNNASGLSPGRYVLPFSFRLEPT